jgi:hypothetical protein
MYIRLFLLALVMPVWLMAQETYPYEWEKNRQRYQISAAEEQLPEVILKEHTAYIYTFEGNQFVMYSVRHRIVRVNTAAAIQRHNRISIGMNKTIALVDVKARSINAQNVTVTLDINNLKEVRDADNNGGAKIFAIEGAEPGSEIEYYFIRKMEPSLFNEAYFQMDVPIKQVSFMLRCPKHLAFDFKSYNGFPDITTDTTQKENVYSVSLGDVPPSHDEPFAFYVAKRMRMEYKLAYNNAKSRAVYIPGTMPGSTFTRCFTPCRKKMRKHWRNL